MDKTAASQGEVLRDFAQLVAKAFFGGLGVAIAMAAAILALSPAAQANDEPRGRDPRGAAHRVTAGAATFWCTQCLSSMRRLERTSLFDTPAGFDEPFEMLTGCHRRIEKQLGTLKRLRSHLEAKGVDAEATSAAQAVLRYFAQAAVSHLADEERDLFPLIERRINDPGEAARFRAFRETLESDHRAIEAAWARLRRPLEGISEGLTRVLPAGDVQAFIEAYTRHILAEENTLKEFFDRWLDDGDRQMLGRSMAARRGISAPRA